MTNKNVEPNYHIVLLSPAGSLQPAKEVDILIPQITQTSTLLDLVVARQGLDENKTWGLFDMKYPDDEVNTTTYPLLLHYHAYRGNGKGYIEFEIKEVV